MQQKIIKKRLQKLAKEVCYQIGIPAIQEPKICWNREQFKWHTGKRHGNKWSLGTTHFKNNSICIDINNHYNYPVHPEKYGTLRELRDTLIHELVHMRWQKQKHGTKFNNLIERIKKGEVFPMRTEADVWKYLPH
jgi:hypothetical protein